MRGYGCRSQEISPPRPGTPSGKTVASVTSAHGRDPPTIPRRARSIAAPIATAPAVAPDSDDWRMNRVGSWTSQTSGAPIQAARNARSARPAIANSAPITPKTPTSGSIIHAVSPFWPR
jgi:hypothetical protein